MQVIPWAPLGLRGREKDLWWSLSPCTQGSTGLGLINYREMVGTKDQLLDQLPLRWHFGTSWEITLCPHLCPIQNHCVPPHHSSQVNLSSLMWVWACGRANKGSQRVLSSVPRLPSFIEKEQIMTVLQSQTMSCFLLGPWPLTRKRPSTLFKSAFAGEDLW